MALSDSLCVGLLLALERLISDGVLPDIADSTLENRLHALTVDDPKFEVEATDAKNTTKLKKFMRLYQATNVDLGTPPWLSLSLSLSGSRR